MDDISYGAYNFYFSLITNLGSFPLSVDNRGNTIKVATGFSFWLYYINFVIALFHCFFQIFQLFFFSISGAEQSILLIAQLTWVLLALLPLANYYFLLNNEDHFAEIIDEWCQLERRIIGKIDYMMLIINYIMFHCFFIKIICFSGSAMRGVNFGGKKNIPQLSLCHANQTRRFYIISRLYIFLALLGAIAVGGHAYYEPRYPGYLYWMVEEDNELLKNLSGMYEKPLLSLILKDNL